MEYLVLFNGFVFAFFICSLLNNAVKHITTHATNPQNAPSFFKENWLEFVMVFWGIVTNLFTLHAIAAK